MNSTTAALTAPTPFTPDPENPVMRDLILPLKSGKVAGTFLVLAMRGNLHVALIALKVPGYKPGTPFGLRERRAGKQRRIKRWYEPNENLYTMLRAYRDRIPSWVAANAETVRKFGVLSGAEMLARYGVDILEPGKLAALRLELQPLLSKLSRSWDISHAQQLYEVTPGREGVRATLGFASMAASIQSRLAELEGIGQMVVSVSAVVADYLDKQMGVVRTKREVLDALLVGDEFFDPGVVAQLRQDADTLATVLVVRPHTHVGENAPKDLREAADIIESLLGVSMSARAGATEGIRNLLVAARNSLVVLERQYAIEELITYLSTYVHDKKEFTPKEREDLTAWLRRLLDSVPESLGSRFKRKSNPVPKMRAALGQAIAWCEDPAAFPWITPVNVKEEVTLASRAA